MSENGESAEKKHSASASASASASPTEEKPEKLNRNVEAYKKMLDETKPLVTGQKRLLIEYQQFPSEYMIEVLSSKSWRIKKDELTVRVEIPTNYPFGEPILIVESPASYYWKNRLMWGPTKTIKDALMNLLAELETLENSITPQTKVAIENAKEQKGDLTLILGAEPSEDRRGRTFYEDKSVYLLDYTEPQRELDNSRYFQIDFNNQLQFYYLALHLPKKFKTLCFDYSTMKFFSFRIETFESRLRNLNAILKDDGTLYMETPGGMHSPLDPRNFMKLYEDAVLNAGFEYEKKEANEMEEIPIIRRVFLEGTYKTPNLRIWVLKKKRTEGGKRRKTRRRRRGSRKHPKVRKYII